MSKFPSQHQKNTIHHLLLNAAIGFLTVLLIGLLIALSTRLIYPRIVNNRVESNSQLISNVIQIEVLNGCGINGIARSYTEVLRKSGFDVVEIGNFDHDTLEKTFIISRNGIMDNARQIARALGVSETNIVREESPDFYLDVTVIIGHDYEQLNTK